MKKKTSNTNFFDDMDTWSDSPTAYNKKPFTGYQSGSTDSSDSDWGYFMEDSAPRHSGTGLQRAHSSHRRKKKSSLPALLAAALVLALAFILLGRDSESKPEPPAPTVALREENSGIPFPTIAPIETVPAATIAPIEILPAATAPVPQKEYRYFGRMLNPDQRQIYDRIQEGLAVHAATIGPFNVSSTDEMQLIIQSVCYDYPEYFWFRGAHSSSYFDRTTYLEYTVQPTYQFSAAEYSSYSAFVETAAQPILDLLRGKSDYEKVKGVYEYLIDNTIYDLNYTGTSIYEMFRDGRAVCEGYARATQYLLTKLDVECLYVTGDSGEFGEPRSSWETHAWNIVKIDGSYYQVDTTWGDPLNPTGVQTKRMSYLNLTDAEMSQRHEGDNWNYYPTCTDTYYNYYQYEGNYLEVFSRETITVWFQTAYSMGLPLEFKCANRDVYQMTCAWLIDNDGFNELFRAVNNTNQYSYITNDELYILQLSQT